MDTAPAGEALVIADESGQGSSGRRIDAGTADSIAGDPVPPRKGAPNVWIIVR